MPKIVSKEPTLNGEAFIIKYEHRDTYYLRVKRDGKRYTNSSLNTADINVARKNALSTYVELSSSAPKTRNSKYAFNLAVDEFLTFKAKQVERGQIKESSLLTYEQRLNQRIIPFARSKEIKNISDIDGDSFMGYADFYLDIKQKGKWKNQTNGLSASTINSDITTLNEFLFWLVGRGVLQHKNIGKIPKVKDRKNYKEEANPAFFPDEFALFKDVLYRFDQNVADEEARWKRRWFINWVSFQYQGAFRLHETSQIRLGDCRVEKRPDGKVKGIVNVAPTTKTGKRIVIMNGNTLNKVKYHLNKGIKIRNQQLSVKGKEPIALAGKDDFLMMNPFMNKRKVYTDEHIRGWWKQILKESGLEKNYTLYSLRSTHITHALMNGMTIRQIADNCGTSQSQIERTYFRLNNLLNIDNLGFHKEKERLNLEIDSDAIEYNQ